MRCLAPKLPVLHGALCRRKLVIPYSQVGGLLIFGGRELVLLKFNHQSSFADVTNHSISMIRRIAVPSIAASIQAVAPHHTSPSTWVAIYQCGLVFRSSGV